MCINHFLAIKITMENHHKIQCVFTQKQKSRRLIYLKEVVIRESQAYFFSACYELTRKREVRIQRGGE